MKVGFIGLGNMGTPIARNLLHAGHELAVYNRTRARAEPLEREGARVASSPGDASRGCEAVITMLADDNALRETSFGDDGVLAALPPGGIHISMSTISVDLSRTLAREHGNRQQGYIASPVLGRPEAAAAKKLLVLAAGPPEQVERCRPVLEAVGRGVTVFGQNAWQANIVKLASNFLIVSLIESLGEAFALLRKSGISPKDFLEMASPLFGSPVFQVYGQLLAEEKYEPAGFRLKLGLKDVNLALAAAGEQAVPMPLASLAREHFLQGIAHGYADQDWAALARVIAENAGVSQLTGAS